VKRFSFLVGVGVGFVVGSRAGSEPYQKLAATVQKAAKRSETQRAVDQVKGVARQRADAAVHKIGEKLPSSDTTVVPAEDADHPQIDPENIAGAGEDAADRGITGLEI
jgi:hypothetical protein